MAVPLFDTRSLLACVQEEIRQRVEAVIDRGVYILGPEVEAFERQLATYIGVRHAVGVANGTDAITIALRAMGVGSGAEVVVPSFTFYATAEAVVNAGAVPVFCDVDFETRNVSTETVSAAVTDRTAAVIAVDLFGCPAPIPELRELGLPVLEDAAQAAGASLGSVRAGALGHAATFSFYPSKNLGGFGDGGAILTDDDQLAEMARALRFHGSHDKRSFQYVGYNSRLDELQAAVLRVLLPHLDEWCTQRRAVAREYRRSGLGDHVRLPAEPEGALPAWHLYVVLHERADSLIATLGEAGIQSRSYYRTPLHRQPAMTEYGEGVKLPVTDELARSNLALPMSPALGAEQAREVVRAVAAAA